MCKLSYDCTCIQWDKQTANVQIKCLATSKKREAKSQTIALRRKRTGIEPRSKAHCSRENHLRSYPITMSYLFSAGCLLALRKLTQLTTHSMETLYPFKNSSFSLQTTTRVSNSSSSKHP